MVHGKDMRFFPHSYFSTPSMGSNLLIFGATRGFVGGVFWQVYIYIMRAMSALLKTYSPYTLDYPLPHTFLFFRAS